MKIVPPIPEDFIFAFLRGTLNEEEASPIWTALREDEKFRAEIELLAGFSGLVIPEYRSSGTCRTEAIVTPGIGKDYANLFGNFDSNEFFAFNAPFQIENEGVFSAESLRVQSERYQSLKSATYLFSDEESLKRAKSFFDVLNARLSNTLSGRIRLLCIQDPTVVLDLRQRAPSSTYFAGYHQNTPRCVEYQSVSSAGLPLNARVVEGDVKLEIALLRHFDYAKWLIQRSRQSIEVVM